MTFAIQVENLSKRYGDKVAVDGLSFDVNQGEIFALIGPNGAGKSTTIRIILDIIKADSGRVSVFGAALNDAAKNRIGYLPEERGLYKGVNLLNLLTYLGQLKGMSRHDAQTRAADLLTQLELGDYMKKKVSALSKGMAQKVQVAATILHRPELIIIDEPFSGLDPVNTQILKDMLYKTMQEDGTAVVMSTHQMRQLQEMAHRMLMIAKGQRVLYGPVMEVRQQYAENAVIVVGEGDWARLDGVQSVEPRKNGDMLLHLAPDVSPDHIMQAIASGDYRIQRFELAIPDLEEVFIRVVGGDVRDLAANGGFTPQPSYQEVR